MAILPLPCPGIQRQALHELGHRHTFREGHLLLL